MYYGCPNYAEIERQAHEMRRQAIADIGRYLWNAAATQMSALRTYLANARHSHGLPQAH